MNSVVSGMEKLAWFIAGLLGGAGLVYIGTASGMLGILTLVPGMN